MPSKSKSKGNRFERLCVNIAKEYNINAIRAWGSDGRSLGEDSEVDVMLGKYKAQCKTRKRIAKWLKPNTIIDFQLVKEDRGQIYAILTYESLLRLLSKETHDTSPKTT